VADYPSKLVTADHTEPVPRRIRAVLGGQTVVDTVAARYVWETPAYPQYYVPLADVADGVLVDEGTTEETSRGDVAHYGLRVGALIACVADDAERAEGVRIFIGSENKLFSLSGSSTIIAPYGDAAGHIVGVLGVIGPTRLNYARVIPMVDYTAKVISKLLAG